MATARLTTDDQRLSQICKALGCRVRVQILRYVTNHPNCIGNDILLHLPEDGPHAQSTLSQHLRVLRNAGLLDAEGDGPAVCYRVNHISLEWVRMQIAELG